MEKGYTYPEGTTVVDAGVLGLALLDVFRTHDRVLVVDAADGTGEPPGAVVRIAAEDVAAPPAAHSLHDVRLSDVLQAAALLGSEPEVEIVAVQVASVEEMVTVMSPEVEAAVPLVVEAVHALLAECGVEALPRV
jgi:hydrogenase maturation protease